MGRVIRRDIFYASNNWNMNHIQELPCHWSKDTMVVMDNIVINL